MSGPIRLTAVLTHPVQYLSPWFRHIAAECPEIALTVLYVVRPTAEQQGVGYSRAFQWDQPLTAGYDCRFLREPRPEDRLDTGAFGGLDAPGIGREIAATRPQVVLVPGWHKRALLRALRACRRMGIPLLYRGDSNLATAPAGAPRRRLWRWRTRWLLGHFSAYLATGELSRRYLLELGRPGAPIFRSPHCVDNEFFAALAAPHQGAGARADARRALGLDPNSFVVLFAGRLAASKRPLDLVRAMAEMTAAPAVGPAIGGGGSAGSGAGSGGGAGPALLVVGSGPLEDACRGEAERLGVRASWAGFLNQSELGRAYAAADCLVLPSDASETWGLVVNEAMATGLPAVVSADVGCAPDLIAGGETGEVYPRGDIAALAAALGRMRRALAGGHDLAAACRARAAGCSFAAATAGLRAACVLEAGRFSARGSGRPTPPRDRISPAPPAAEPATDMTPALRSAVERAAAGRRDRPPRILACCGGMVIVSGLERLTFEVLRVLRRRGAAVHCILNSWESHRILPLAEAIGASWSIGSYRADLDRHTRDPRKLARLAWDIARTSGGLLRDARRFQPTAVLCPDFGSVLRNAPALLLLRARGVPVVLRVGNAPERGPFYARLWRRVLSPLVTRIVANSAFGFARLLEVGVPRRKLELIPNSVAERPAPSPDRESGDGLPALVRARPTILCVGQIAPFKGTHLAVEAVLALAAEGRDVQGVIVGRIPEWPPDYAAYAKDLMARAAQEGQERRVHFAGERQDVLALMADAYLLVAPILQEETFGNVVLEAKSVGLPAVVFPQGGLVELVEHGVDGYLCAEQTLDGLLAGLRHFMSGGGVRERAGRAARESYLRRAADYGRESFEARWWQVLGGGGAPGQVEAPGRSEESGQGEAAGQAEALDKTAAPEEASGSREVRQRDEAEAPGPGGAAKTLEREQAQ